MGKYIDLVQIRMVFLRGKKYKDLKKIYYRINEKIYVKLCKK